MQSVLCSTWVLTILLISLSYQVHLSGKLQITERLLSGNCVTHGPCSEALLFLHKPRQDSHM